MVFESMVSFKKIQMVTCHGGMAYDRCKRAVFSEDSPIRFTEPIVSYIDFQTFAGVALGANGAKIHHSKTSPPAKDQCFTLFFGALLDDFIVDALVVAADITARFMQSALFDHIHKGDFSIISVKSCCNGEGNDMKEWIVNHQRKLSLGIGVVLILFALGELFWDNSSGGSGEKREVQSTQNGNARVIGSGSSAPSPSAESPIMKAYREKQAEHLRYTLIATVMAGIGFLIYGWVTKKRE